ncbi:MAG TPA: hypothetical protein VK524_27160, partial [Polyangiaceae bacterium]|nr:hypothetical protein [Polyangiaceae bacterium]
MSIDGADGLLGYAPPSFGVYTVDGRFHPRIALSIPFPRGITVPVQTVSGGSSYDTQKTLIVKARSSADTLAVLTHCQYSNGYCGSSLYFSDRRSFSVDALFANRPLNEVDISAAFATYYAGFALDSAGNTVVASHIAGASCAIGIKKLGVNHELLAETRLPLATRDRAQVTDVATDASGRVFVLYSFRPPAAIGPNPVAPGSRIALLDPELRILKEWAAPPNVTVHALALGSGVEFFVAGSVQTSTGARSWLDKLDSTTLASVWSAPRIGAAGAASALDSGADGRLWIAGVGATEQTAWLERYDAEGTPVWPYRSELTATGYFLVSPESARAHFRITGVAEQRDGSVLVSSTSTFRFEP